MRFSTLLLLPLLAVGLIGCKDDSAPAEQVTAPAKTFHWKMVTTWPKNAPGTGTAAERLAERVNAMSAGRLTIKVYAAGELVPALEVFDAVSRGTAELGHGTPYYWKGKVPAAQFFGAVRWNQEFFSRVPDGAGLTADWGRELWRLDVAPGYRLTPHMQFKLQYSLQHELGAPRPYAHTLATQFMVRF